MGFDRKTKVVSPEEYDLFQRTKHHSFFYWKILKICPKNTHILAPSLLLKEILKNCIINSPNLMEGFEGRSKKLLEVP
jgi:hypothetical protein